MIKCNKCGELKETSEFYGVSKECKVCVKARVNKRERELRKDLEWVEKEKIRARAKYKRLRYKDKQKVWDKDKPWKNTAIYKNLNRDLRVKKLLRKGQKVHHWSYENESLRDIFIMSDELHRKIHAHISPVDKIFYFNSIPLTSKERHFSLILEIMRLENIKEDIIWVSPW